MNRWIPVLVCTLVLTGCETTQKYYEETDRRIIDDSESLTGQVVNDYQGVVGHLPIEQQLFQIPRLGAMPAGSRGAFEIVVSPNYVGDLTALTPDSKAQLDKLVARLRGRDKLNLRVVGHASSEPLSPQSQSQYENNQVLSEHRAQVVADYLKSALGEGVSVAVSGQGERQPVADNATRAGRNANRRVVIGGSFAEPGGAPVAQQQSGIPVGFQPWWRPMITNQLDDQSLKVVRGNPDDLYLRALEHSSQIKVFSDIPLIRETAILEAEGRFDPHAFAELKYSDINEPVGSTLTTGGPDRFSEQEKFGEVGIRKTLTTGGEVEVSQRLGGKQNNSVFFVPDDQASTRLNMRFTQPLLNGGGIDYNRSTVAIAKLDSSIAEDEFQRQVESHLLEISRAYWSLYRERAIMLQKRKLAEDTESVVFEMEQRRGVDVLQSQLARARAALAMRRADSIRAELAVRNSQSRLAALINDPELIVADRFEFVTTAAPLLAPKELSVREAGERALQNRPEIDQVMKQVKAAAIRAKMSKRELLPILDFVIEGRLDGLDGGHRLGSAWENQFDEGEPSAAVGLQLDVPLGNRIAKARHQRRRVEERQLTNQLRTTIDTVLLEVEVAVREINTAYREANSKYHALAAAQTELDTMIERRSLQVSPDVASQLYLDNLLDAQQRLASSEQDLVSSLAVYNVALRNLDRVTGVLLQTEGITPRRVEDQDGLPRIILEKG